MFKAIKNYDNKAIEPYLSEETLMYHFEKHHSGYANTLTSLTKGTNLENLSIEEIILKKEKISSKIYNNAAQIFNHDFYWKSISLQKNTPSNELLTLIGKTFVNIEEFYNTYTSTACEIFGSGWSWLVLDKNSSPRLRILNTCNADNPLIYDNLYPILTIDLWEHAYYIDYRNDRKAYLERVINNCLNWKFASEQLQKFTQD